MLLIRWSRYAPAADVVEAVHGAQFVLHGHVVDLLVALADAQQRFPDVAVAQDVEILGVEE